MMRRNQDQEQQSKMICELSSLLFNLLLQSSPTPLSYSDRSPILPVNPSVLRRSSAAGQITPAGFAAFVLGISVALMLCGSVTFVIGFMLMPWVIGLVMVFYVAGVVSFLSVLGRSILCFASPRKHSPEWKLL